MERIGLSMYPVDSIGRFDDRGREYDLGNEAAGIVDFRVIKVKPEEAMTYKIAQYTKSRSNAKSLFNAVALRGGVVTPKELVDAYINANRALFNAQKVMNRDIGTAKILNADQSKIVPELIGRLGKKEFGTLQAGIFMPYIPSKSIFIKSQQIASKLGVKNPLPQAIGAMANVRAQLFRVNLNEDEFPTVENPLDTPIIPDLIGDVSRVIGNLNLGGGDQTTGAAIAQEANKKFGSVSTGMTEQEKFAALFPDDTTSQLAANRRVKKPINQTTNQNMIS